MGNTSYSQINSVSRVRFEITLRSNIPCTKEQCQSIAAGFCKRKATGNLSTIQPSKLISRIPLSPAKDKKKKKEKEEKTVIEFPSSFETSSFFNDISNFVFPSATSLRTLRFLVVRGFLEILSRATPPHKTGNLITARLFDGKSDTILPSHESRGFSPSFRRRRRRCPRR